MRCTAFRLSAGSRKPATGLRLCCSLPACSIHLHQTQPVTEQVAERHVVSCHRWRELAADITPQQAYA
jgi:peptide/nickel transport system ATP-binding protein